MKRITNLCLVILVSSFILTGCATALLSSMPVSRTTTSHKFDSDVIRYIANPKSSKYEGLVLIGDNYMYHLDDTKSINEFNTLTNNLNREHIEFIGKLKIVKSKDNTIYIVQEINYSKPNDSYSASEEKAFNALNCHSMPATKTKGTYKSCIIELTGKLYKNTQANTQPTANASLQRPVQVDLVKITSHSDYSEKLFALPFTLAFDTITSPIQLLYILGNK